MQPYIPTVSPHATLPSLEARRIHLLDQLQATDFESTTILRSLHAIQSQLDHPLPLPPHEVQALRRNMKIQRWALWRSEEKEMDILVRLGEVALRTQRIGQWERVCWEAQQGVRHGLTAGENWMVEPPAMNGQVYRAQNVYRVSRNGCAPAPPHIQAYGTQPGTQPEGANPTSHNLGAPVTVDAGYQYPNSIEQLDSSPPCVGLPAHPSIALGAMEWQQAQHLAPPAFAWQHTPESAGQGWNYYDNTSHVTSAATTRRNTAIGSMLPPSVPHNSRHGSIAAPGQGVSGSDLSQRIEQAVGSGRFRKSEPGLVVQCSAEGQGRGYV